MRKITVAQVAAFVALQAVAVALTLATVFLGVDRLPLGDFRGVILSVGLVVFLYVYAVLVYRLFLARWPLGPGDIVPGSGQESVYHVYILFYLILFYPVLRSGLLPTPAMRLFYLALGTRLGPNTYTQGILHDPPFIEIGANSVVGQSALLIPHVIEGKRLAHYPIRIGDRVTIGALSAILADVTIGDDAIVATGAVVPKGSRIPAGEVWGGVPARRIGSVGTVAESGDPA